MSSDSNIWYTGSMNHYVPKSQQQTASVNINLLFIFVPITTSYNNEIWYTHVLYQDIFEKQTIACF